MMQVIGRNEEGNALHESETAMRAADPGIFRCDAYMDYPFELPLHHVAMTKQGKTGIREEKLKSGKRNRCECNIHMLVTKRQFEDTWGMERDLKDCMQACGNRRKLLRVVGCSKLASETRVS